MAGDSQSSIPLCVDLDGTLVNSDTLVESAVLLIKINPLHLFAMLYWLLSGKANLKEQIALRVCPDVGLLPYNQSFLRWLRKQHDAGRSLVLATASNIRTAEAVSAHLGLFESVIASSATQNLSAHAKCDALVQQFGDAGFDYAGNSLADVPVWEKCRRAVVVNASTKVSRSAAACAEIEKSFVSATQPLRGLLLAMRPHQWSKNTLIFVSMVVSHHYMNTQLVLSTLIAFVAFCLCSSSVYLINDMLDLQADRRHGEKHTRPFASAQSPLLLGIVAAPLLLLVSAVLALMASTDFFIVLLMYFTLTVAYSFYLKRVALLDVLVLAVLYTLRIVAGAAVAVEVPSVWLITFSLFVFTSLAMAKRYAELKALEADSGVWAGGRGYHVRDLHIISQLGVTAGFISTLVLALYIDSPEVVAAYENQAFMWFLVPLLMYWIARIWLVASRGQLDQDPVIFATRDRTSYVVMFFGLMTIVAAL